MTDLTTTINILRRIKRKQNSLKLQNAYYRNKLKELRAKHNKYRMEKYYENRKQSNPTIK